MQITMKKLVRRITAITAALSILGGVVIGGTYALLEESRASLLSLSTARNPGGGVFFNSGAFTQQAPTWLTSAADIFGLPKPSTLANLAGSGPHSFFQFYIKALATPQPVSMPVTVVNDSSIGDIFRIDLLPPETPVVWWDYSKNLPTKTTSTFGAWTMRTLIAGTLNGAYAYSNYITILPKFNYLVNQLIQVFYQWDTGKFPLQAGQFPNAGNLLVTHFIKGQPSNIAVQETRYGDYYPTLSGVYRPNGPINVPWGATLDAPGEIGQQPSYSVGYDPLTLTAMHGILGPITGEFGRFPADPIGAVAQSVDAVTGNFTPPPLNGTGLANRDYPFPSAISLSGLAGGGFNDYSSNQGIQLIDTLELDTGMYTHDGFSAPGSTPDPGNDVPAADFFGPGSD